MAGIAAPHIVDAAGKAVLGTVIVIGGGAVADELLSRKKKSEESPSAESACQSMSDPSPSMSESDPLRKPESVPSGFVPLLPSSSELVNDKAIRDAARGVFAPDAIENDFSLRQQAARDPPIRVRNSGGSNWRIEVPFPYSIPVGLGYLLYQALTSSDSGSGAERRSQNGNATAAAPSPAATTDSASITIPIPPPDDEQESGSDSDFEHREDQPSRYRKLGSKELKRLLDTDGEKIYRNLEKKAKADFSPGAPRTIWENRDFRFDVGHLDSNTSLRHWEFQVNRNPESKAAKRLLKASKKGSHQKLFKGTFDVNNPPKFEEWKKAVLECLE